MCLLARIPPYLDQSPSYPPPPSPAPLTPRWRWSWNLILRFLTHFLFFFAVSDVMSAPISWASAVAIFWWHFPSLLLPSSASISASSSVDATSFIISWPFQDSEPLPAQVNTSPHPTTRKCPFQKESSEKRKDFSIRNISKWSGNVKVG